ncbi:hypothetical protein Cob_v000479 [Colletotrichum orbiculare MAFF 240422]|uniref:Uncharacterized protein n=1 Tax=Colletotrichum orbiculare (strain 104-T / ATCC 96160 / CBS 514.97 / LARS 414 / MAFF 240422) TaxID=1213857 RepID=A0A484G8K0_COLOR|nr:hypothetical protein Cob_v000479 [Colletotrichum orbiculare MAFF 240422]
MLLSQALAVLLPYITVASAARCNTQSYPGTVYKVGTVAECTGRDRAVCAAGQEQTKLLYSYDGNRYNEGNACAVAVTCCTK